MAWQSHSPMTRIELEQTLCMFITVFFSASWKVSSLPTPNTLTHLPFPSDTSWWPWQTLHKIHQPECLSSWWSFLMHLGNLILISKREVSGDFDEKKLGYPAVLRVSIQHQALQCPEFVKKLAEGVEGEKTSLKKTGLIQSFPICTKFQFTAIKIYSRHVGNWSMSQVVYGYFDFRPWPP